VASWSGPLAGHDGFRAGVRAGPAVFCGLGHQSRPDGIIFDVQEHTLKFALVTYPIVIVAHDANQEDF
jgi:hypothetical protein